MERSERYVCGAHCVRGLWGSPLWALGLCRRPVVRCSSGARTSFVSGPDVYYVVAALEGMAGTLAACEALDFRRRYCWS